MGRFIIIVLDGFGVGAMPDVPQVRPQDIGANTCLHILERVPALRLPTLERLGLANALGRETTALHFSADAVFGRAMLLHDGADTFYGHQEIMGTRPAKPRLEVFHSRIQAVKEALMSHGYAVREYRGSRERFLIVNEAVTVADNVECDPGLAFNVTAALDDLPFAEELKIGRLVREVAKVPRVIVFGGRGVHLQNLLDAVEEHGEYIGVNAPASGVYQNDYHCIHMGYGVDATVQAPTILGEAGIPVFLLGKAADVIANPKGESDSIVDTGEVLERLRALVEAHPQGFFCANVQETDLCGHREDAPEYARKLEIADRGITELLPILAPEDRLVVMADHGNDPTIGHPHHTREMVPLLLYGAEGPRELGTRTTLADVGATALAYFDAPPPENGQSFLSLIR